MVSAFALEWAVAVQELVHYDTASIPVGLHAGHAFESVFFPDFLWGHVLGRTHYDGFLGLLDDFGLGEIGQADIAFMVKLDLGWGQIAVDDVISVKVSKAKDQLGGVLTGTGLGKSLSYSREKGCLEVASGIVSGTEIQIRGILEGKLQRESERLLLKKWLVPKHTKNGLLSTERQSLSKRH